MWCFSHWLLTKKKTNGFSLSELLVAVAVLGLIAAFAIPRVLVSTQESQRRTLMANAIRTLADASSKITNEPPALTGATSTTWHAYDSELNSADDNYEGAGSANNSFTLPGGVVLNNFNLTYATGLETILMDVNGPELPNLIGQDQIWLVACFAPTGTCPALAITVGAVAQEAGTVGPIPDGGFSAGVSPPVGNVAMYNRIMSVN